MIGYSSLEQPELKFGDRTMLRPGMVFAVGVGDPVIVTEGGYEIATEYPRELKPDSRYDPTYAEPTHLHCRSCDQTFAIHESRPTQVQSVGELDICCHERRLLGTDRQSVHLHRQRLGTLRRP